MRSSQYLLLYWCSRCHDNMLKHFTLQGIVICANFSFTFVELTIANILEDRCTILLCKVPNFKLCIFSIPLLLPTSEIYSAFVAVWDIFCFYLPRYHFTESSRLLPSMFWSNEFLNRSATANTAKSLDIQDCPEPLHLWRTFLQPHAVYMPPNSSSTYSTIFAWLQCLHSRSCIQSEQHSCCLFLHPLSHTNT